MLALSVSLFGYAQTPINDNCSGIIDLGDAPVCPTTIFTNDGATASDIGNNSPSCFNADADHDVWFKFTCPDTLLDFRINLTGIGANSINSPEFAIYRGDCEFNGLEELLCAQAPLGETSLFLDIEGLTPGFTYFIRVSDYSQTGSANSGDFLLCVDKIPPISTVDQGGSTLCEGTLYDSGGPDNDYGNEDDDTFVICPTSTSACIQFTLEYYNIELLSADQLSFYDGNSTSAPLLGSIGGEFFFEGGGGGVCYSVQAQSGCLTVLFTADSDVTLEGFKGSWKCSPEPCDAVPPMITINTAIDADSIAEFVKTDFTTVNVTNINCAEGAYATFSYPTDNNSLQLQKGLLMTSGSAAGVNNIASLLNSQTYNSSGDPDLDALSTGNPSEDACVIELDVFAATDELSFEYVFGSEEYPEYVLDLFGFNDIFAFLISGPGIVGDPTIGGQKNLAVLPNTNIPVEIDAVNNQINWQYYRDNENSQTLVYDGLTADSLGVKKSLTARTLVTPCNTYHLKFAIADRGDASFDSGVFISKIQGGGPNLTIDFDSDINYFVESCTGVQDQLIIKLLQPKDYAVTYSVSVTGSAQLGIDYTLNLPSTITFQPGQTFYSFPIIPIGDNIIEGTETIIISLSSNFGCGDVKFATLVAEIKDNIEVFVSGGDTLKVCNGGNLQLNASGASQYFWSPPTQLNNAFINDPVLLNVTQNMSLAVTGNVGTCVAYDTVNVVVITPEIAVTVGEIPNICLGENIQLQSTNNTGLNQVTWTPSDGLSNPTSPSPLASPTSTTTYTASIVLLGCAASSTITVNVDTLFTVKVANDTTVCETFPVKLGNNVISSSTYTWTPTTGISNPSISGPVIIADETTTYTLTTTSANGYCNQSESVTVTVKAANVDILGAGSKNICLGDTVTLNAVAQPPEQQIKWSPSFYVTNPTGITTKAFPDESVTIFANYQINGCDVRDSIRIRVDSLPDQSVKKVEDKTVYCKGDTIYLISPTYEPASFPDMMHRWLVGPGQLTPDSNWNMVLIATDTFIYQRVTNNMACLDTVDVPINVSEPPVFTITANPNPVCPGQPVQINLSVTPNATFMWQPDPSLPCTDCPNPIVNPMATTSYNVMATGVPCPAGGNIEVQVKPAPLLDLASNTIICVGGSVELNAIVDPLVQSYTWTSVPPGFTSANATPTVSPTVETTYKVVAVGDACNSQDSVKVQVAIATINAGADDELCLGDKLTLTATVSGTPGNVTWTPINEPGNTVEIQPTTTETYTATLVFGPNCEVSDDVIVSITPGVSLSDIMFTPDNTDSICSGQPIKLRVTVTPNDATLVWSVDGTPVNGGAGDSITLVPQLVTGSVQYTVLATATSGCTATAGPIKFDIKNCLLIPNIFSPNGDALNETFGIIVPNEAIQITTFMVFNRWGNKVFEAKGSQKEWDGKIDGKPAPTDTYVYRAEVKYPDGKVEVFKGDVTLIR